MNDIQPVKKKKSIYPLLLGDKIRTRLNEMAAYYEKSVAETIRDAVNFMYLGEYMKHSHGYGKGTEEKEKVSRGNKEQRLNEMLALDNDALNAELERLHVFESFRSSGDMWVFVADDGAGGRTVKYGKPDGSDNGERGFGEVITALRKIL